MTNHNQTQVTLFANVAGTSGTPAPLAEIAEQIKNGCHLRSVTPVRCAHAVCVARSEASKALKDEAELVKKRLKKMVPAVCFGGVLEGRKVVACYSDLIVIDLDHLEDPAHARDLIFEAERSCCLAFISPSGDGVKLVFHHDGGQNGHHLAFEDLTRHLRKAYDMEVDQNGKGVVRLCIMSVDPEARYRDDCEVFHVDLTDEGKGITTTAQAGTGRAPATGYGAFTKEEISAMLTHIPTRPDYAEWVRIISAVGSALPRTEAAEVLREWSPEEEDGEYGRKLESGLNKVTVGTLIWMARGNGYRAGVTVRAKALGIDTVRAAEIAKAIEDGSVVSMLHRRDRGMAEIFQLIRAGQWLFDHGMCSWRSYHDGVWETDSQNVVIEDVQNVVEMVAHEAVAAFDAKTDRTKLGTQETEEFDEQISCLHSVASSILALRKTKAVLENAASLSEMRAGGDAFDASPGILVIQNGVIDFESGEVREHRREDMATMRATFTYDAAATCPRFDRFLDEITCGDGALRAYLLRLMAYATTGYTDHDVAPFHYGDGNNGKSVFAKLMENLLGPFFQRVSYDAFFTGKGGTPVEYAKAELRGRRLIVMTEIPSDSRIQEHIIKDLVGGDTMTGRPIYGRPITFRPTHKLWLVGNHRPQVKDTDTGIWRRLQLVPWKANFAGREESRSDLIEALTSESAGILNRLMSAWREVQAHGLLVPGVVDSATGDYRLDEDQVRRFVEERLEEKHDSKIGTAALHRDYLAWCENQGESSVARASRKFVPELRRLGLSIELGRGRVNFVVGQQLGVSKSAFKNQLSGYKPSFQRFVNAQREFAADCRG